MLLIESSFEPTSAFYVSAVEERGSGKNLLCSSERDGTVDAFLAEIHHSIAHSAIVNHQMKSKNGAFLLVCGPSP